MNEVKLFNPGFLDRQQVSVGDEDIEYIEGCYKKIRSAKRITRDVNGITNIGRGVF